MSTRTDMPSAALPVLYDDADCIAIAKPGSLAVHRYRGAPRGEPFVLQTLAAQVGAVLYPVHRLDRQTSGVLLFARSSAMAAALHANLKDASATKRYLVLVRGETPEVFASDRPLKNKRGEPQPAHSSFRRLATFSRCSLLEAEIRTGRTHQIRRHLSHLAHQVIGDANRGKGRINRFFRETYGLPRMFLHARQVIVAHPRTGATLDLACPLPDDLRGFIERLPDAPPDVLARV